MTCSPTASPVALHITPCSLLPTPFTDFGIYINENEIENSINLNYYAVKDPILTNNKCECLNISADDASLYFENLGMFSNLLDCSKLSYKENAHLLDDRNKLKEIEAVINVYSQQEDKIKLVDYINANVSKEIKTHIDEEGEFKITRTVPSLRKPVSRKSPEIPEIQFMPETEQMSREIVESEDSKDINVLNNNELINEIKINKLDVSEKENDVKEIENNAVHLINAVKAKTVFNKMDDTEKESTQFKDRS
jgi:hypothetical protein